MHMRTASLRCAHAALRAAPRAELLEHLRALDSAVQRAWSTHLAAEASAVAAWDAQEAYLHLELSGAQHRVASLAASVAELQPSS
ncbi:MAG: hypothetical protein ACK4ZJ_17380, partial [Allorhizobium sp.]